MKHTNNSTVSCVTQYPQCIEWNMGDIPCLGVKNGDRFDTLTFAIVDKLCKLSAPLDMSSVDITCLIDRLDATEPLTKTIQSYLQLVIDNECTLKELIDAINTRIDGLNPTLTLNLRCLVTLDSFGQPLPYTEQSVLQSLIDATCDMRAEVATIVTEIAGLQAQIDALPAPFVEPIVTTCVFTSKTASQGIILLATDYCAYKTSVGTTSDISTAIGRQCSGMAAEFAGNANFVQSPTSLAQTINNMWIAYCSDRARISALEACACKFTCDDVKVGFITTFNDDKTVTLKFTSGAGTTIPTGFTDCGSKVTIKNDSGVTTGQLSLAITQEGLSNDLDISMFQAGEYLTFSIEVHMCADGFNCQKCVSKVVRNTSGCCTVSNSGTSDITVVYKVCGITAP